VAVRRKKSPSPQAAPASTKPPPAAAAEEEAPLTRHDIGVRGLIRSLLWRASSTKEICVLVCEQYPELTETQVRRQVTLVREENRAQYALAMKTARPDQVISLRTLYGRMETRLANALAEEAKLKEDAREQKKPVPDYRPSRLVPTYGELLKCQDLIAAVEGNLAPTRQVTVTADVSQATLDFVGAQSAEDLAELLAEGRKLLRDRNVRDVEGVEVG
jgi:hypothetical protein